MFPLQVNLTSTRYKCASVKSFNAGKVITSPAALAAPLGITVAVTSAKSAVTSFTTTATLDGDEPHGVVVSV